MIIWICLAIHKILANKAFTVTDGLISQLFIVTFVHPIYVQIALIWGFPVQISLWKLVYKLWRYKLNEVCDTFKESIWEDRYEIIKEASQLYWDFHKNHPDISRVLTIYIQGHTAKSWKHNLRRGSIMISLIQYK